VGELSGHLEFWQTWRIRLDRAFHTPSSQEVYWLSAPRRANPWLCCAPLDVAERLNAGLFGEPHASVLVSATLSVDGSFNYVQNRVGLPDADALRLGSPFDYKRSALVYVPYDIPDPSQPGYQQVLQETLQSTITEVRGRTLVLFTSRAHLRATYFALKEPLATEGITILGQGIDQGSRTQLLEAFRDGESVALFGTTSFWEGVDVVGDALSCVVVARLPFSVPTDPIYAARAELFDDPFSDYAVPQAVLRFKQGFGRLIRSRTDRGAVLVLDRRIATKKYGASFLRSLPECTVKQGPADRAGIVVRNWVANVAKPETTPVQAIAETVASYIGPELTLAAT
jgi:Rad3-related DNA helicase